MLRDYHSPNLIWLPDRKGLDQVGVLDFQDAVMGPAAYDLASLLQDARWTCQNSWRSSCSAIMWSGGPRTIPRSSRQPSCRSMPLSRRNARPKSSASSSRLERRDGKPQYLRHIPRVWSYLQRSLAHPALGTLREWYDANLPAPKDTATGE